MSNLQKIFTIFAALLSLFLVNAQEFPRAQWLHYPEPDAEGMKAPRYFWLDVEAPANLSKAEIFFHLDDIGELLIDGRAISRTSHVPHPYKQPAHYYDAARLLTPGRHRIEFQCTNLGSAGGILGRILLTTADGTQLEFLSNETWRTAKAPSLAGGEAEACQPAIHGDLLDDTWAALDTTPFFCLEEGAIRKAEAKAKAAENQKILAKLAQEEKPTASVIYQDGRPMIQIGEKIHPAIIYSAHHFQNFDNEKYVKSLENFRDADFHLFVMGCEMRELWLGPGKYNLESLKDWPPEAFKVDPQAQLIFNIDCRMPPRWWCNSHPEELIEYEAPNGEVSYWDEYHAKFVAPSAASELYQKEVCDFLKTVVDYVEAQPWGRRVFGYRFDMGVFMEWHYYGMCTFVPDNSKPMQKRFHQYLTRKYGTDEALQAAWRNPAVTLETAPMASYEQRTTPSAYPWWDPVKDIQAMDSVKCITETVADFMLRGDHVIKEACNRRCLVGNFYGYFFGMNFPAIGWHPLLDKVLRSPDVDFNSQPPPYGEWNRGLGEAQFARGLTSAYRLHNKLYIMEADTRTHEAEYGFKNNCFVKTPRQSVQAMARDFSQALCGGFGFWYFDFGIGWYPSPEIGEYLKKLPEIWNRETDNSSAAQVVIVGDMDSICYQTPDVPLPSTTVHFDRARTTLAKAGAAYDTIPFADVENPALPDYQVYVFLNVGLNNAERTALAQRLRQAGKTLVWLDRPGYLDEQQGASLESTAALTGVPAEKILQRSGAITHQANPEGGDTYIAFNAEPTVQEFQEIFLKAGVHLYCEDGETPIYANRSYLAVHAGKPGPRLLHLPRASRLVQLLPEYRILAEDAVEYVLDAETETTYLLKLE